MRITRWLAWIGWYVVATLVVAVWTLLSSIPYSLVHNITKLILAGRPAPVLLAWLALPLLLGAWPYLLLRLTARAVGLNRGIFWFYTFGIVLTVYTVIATSLGLENDPHAYKLFGFNPVSHGLGVWAAWSLLAACSVAGALVVFRTQRRRITPEIGAEPGHG